MKTQLRRILVNKYLVTSKSYLEPLCLPFNPVFVFLLCFKIKKMKMHHLLLKLGGQRASCCCIFRRYLLYSAGDTPEGLTLTIQESKFCFVKVLFVLVFDADFYIYGYLGHTSAVRPPNRFSEVSNQ